MKKFVSLLIAVLLVMALLVPAAISAPAAVSASVAPPEPPPASGTNLIAGQHILVGTVYVWNDTVNLYVKYETTDGWEMTETHLTVATAPGNIPQTKGNPIPGHFPYMHENLDYVTSDLYTIPLTELGGGTSFYIAAHAKVEWELQTETAWAEGLPFPGKNWATYFTYTVQPVLLETVSVNANNASTTYSTTVLEIGKNYQLKVSGTAYANDTIWFDAKYSNSTKYSSPADSWTDYVAGYAYLGTDLLNLAVNGVFVEWGDYNPYHIYYWDMAGDDSPLAVALWIYDIPPYSNNSESLTVEIYWTP